MALTPAEKMRKRRLKLKEEGKYEEYNRKIKEKMKAMREKHKIDLQKLGPKKREKILTEERRKTRERVAKHRRLKKSREIDSPSAFKNCKTLGKATTRARKALPKSPRKRKSVVRKLFATIVGDVDKNSQNNICNKDKNQNSLALSDDTVNAVKEFFEREDISRYTPGMKDCISIKNSQWIKERVQVRYLCNSILETHALFKSETGIQIGKSKFAEIRPKHIKLSSKLPHNVCLCKYHENFLSAVAALHKSVPSFPKYSLEFCDFFLCNPNTEHCWLGSCEKCNGNFTQLLDETLEEQNRSGDEATWYEWKEVEGCLTKVVNEGTIGELSDYINTIYRQFCHHVYVKRMQAKSYENQKKKVTTDRAVAIVHVDFSENYTCIAQDEIQSYHWGQPQVTLFTCSLWFDSTHHPYVIVSDNLNHSKDTLLAYLYRVFDEIPDDVKEVQIWSDGPSSQFKNKYIAAALKVLQNRKCKKITWNYFATSHGKGPVDGIGGAVKRSVRQEVLKNKTLVFNAEDFYKTALSVSSVSIILMKDEDILKINGDMNLTKVFGTAPTIKGISKIHAMKFSRKTGLQTYFLTKDLYEPVPLISEDNVNTVEVATSTFKRRSIYHDIYSSSESSDDEYTISQEIQAVTYSNIKHGTFVKVVFDQENTSKQYTYAAICQTPVDSEMDVRILCLSKIGNSKRSFRVNTQESEPYVKFSQIVEILPVADVKFSGERMYYCFPKDISVNEK